MAAAAVAVVVTTTAAAGLGVGLSPGPAADDLPAPDPCGKSIELPYVALGDGVPFGAKEVADDQETTDADRFPEKLTKILQEQAHFPFCLHNVSQGEVTTDDYQDEDTEFGFTQQSLAEDLRPRLITLTLGREQDGIREHISTCMTFIKNHQFIEANACALAVYAAEPAWTKLNDDLSDILNQLKVQLDGNPRTVVAVMGYFNPYPDAVDVATDIPGFCGKLVDTIPTCTVRWVMLPPVLVTMDQITKKLNSTIKAVVDKFALASQGSFYFVNPYEAFEDHCMSMDVEIKTTVYHPTNQVDHHDSTNDFGCETEWVQSDKTNGELPPWHYLPPAVTGVLINTTQTTKNMGAYPNADGNDCLAKLVYNATNGWEPLKNKLGIPEAVEEDPC